MGDLKILILLAWRNVWRNRRRTLLTVLTIVVGCAMIIFNNALFHGGTEKMIEDAVTLNTGYLQIHQKGYWENRTIDRAFIPGEELLTELNRLKGERRITGYSFRICSEALLSRGGATFGAVLQSIEPGRDRGITSLQKRVLPGGRELREEDGLQVLIGESLARNLRAAPGDEISMLSQAFDGSMAAERLVVAGIFRSGNPQYDRAYVLMPYRQAAASFSLGDYVHAVVIGLPQSSEAINVEQRLRGMAEGAGLEILDWNRLIPEIVQFVVMDISVGYVFDIILFVVVAFGVLNTIQMSVLERTKEFGVMLSIGTSPGKVFSMVMMEALLISLAGILIGAALGSAASYYVKLHPFDYSRWAEEFAVWGVLTTVYPARMTLMNLFMTSGITFLLIAAFTCIPALRASRLRPVEAMRHL